MVLVKGASTASRAVGDRFLDSGDEAGTAPGDRKFRPDVEGLRAVAVLLVVLYHAGVSHLTGGYVGVDVFFVISGFVITGLLLRTQRGSGRTSIADFYARRIRRILPSATLVIAVTVVAAYVAVGVVTGNNVADDGRWAAVFLANFHFESVDTNYLSASLPPSPLQNYWSLSVEEQFYVVYPTLFLLVAKFGRRRSLRTQLAVLLGAIIVASYWLSVVQTSSHPTVAYFSPFTRAWELALGGLVAVATRPLIHVPQRLAAGLTWAGLVAIAWSTTAFTSHTAYPGSLVAVPVVGAALVIAGGVAIPRWGAESLLGRGPAQWLGKRSYSFYLWHWPLLIIVAERVDKTTLPVSENLVLLAVALVLSMATYRLVEHPIRQWRLPTTTTLLAGVSLVTITALVLSMAIATHAASASDPYVVPAASQRVLLDQVDAAHLITTVPESIRKSEYGAAYSQVSPDNYVSFAKASERVRVLGDTKGSRLMVVYGDSHASMWLPAFSAIAKADHWRLVLLAKLGCPAALVSVRPYPTWGVGETRYTACDEWHAWATDTIKEMHPNLLIISQKDSNTAVGPAGSAPVVIGAAQWKVGLAALLATFRVPDMRVVLLGTTPILPLVDSTCLAAHSDNVQSCSVPVEEGASPLDQVDRAAASSAHVGYVNTLPWFCSRICTPIVGDLELYDSSGTHVSSPYARYLQNVIAEAIGLPPSGR